MNPTHLSYLREMGLGPVWRLRGEQAAAPVAKPAPPIAPSAPPAPAVAHIPVADMDWDALEHTVQGCRACRLCEARKQVVFGVGDRAAPWLFVGEGPGAEEDRLGEPFVGQAGKLLDAMLATLGLRRGHGVYIANAVKCRPPENRTPEAEEIAACNPYLLRQVALIRPRIIVALGKPAAHALLGREVKIAEARGQVFEVLGVPVVVTYHPAYLLRNQPDKALAWQDLLFARDTLARRAE